MIKTPAELADEQAKQAIEDIKGIRPRVAGNGPAPQPMRSLLQVLENKRAKNNDRYSDLIAYLRHFMAEEDAAHEAWQRLMGTK